jgi:hypothetical protein
MELTHIRLSSSVRSGNQIREYLIRFRRRVASHFGHRWQSGRAVTQHGTLDHAAISRPIHDENDLFRQQARGQLLKFKLAAAPLSGYAAHVHDNDVCAAHQLYNRGLPGVVAATKFVDAITAVRIRLHVESGQARIKIFTRLDERAR